MDERSGRSGRLEVIACEEGWEVLSMGSWREWVELGQSGKLL